MSSKSLKTLSVNTYIVKNDNRLLKLSDNYFFNKHFLLGVKIDRDELLFSTIFDSLLYSKNCEILDLIKDKIEGKLEPKKIIPLNTSTTSTNEEDTCKDECEDIEAWTGKVEW